MSVYACTHLNSSSSHNRSAFEPVDTTCIADAQKMNHLFPSLLSNHKFILFPLWHKIHGPDINIADLIKEICCPLGLRDKGCKFCDKKAKTIHTSCLEISILLCTLARREFDWLFWLEDSHTKRPTGYVITLHASRKLQVQVKTPKTLDSVVRKGFKEFGLKIGYLRQ